MLHEKFIAVNTLKTRKVSNQQSTFKLKKPGEEKVTQSQIKEGIEIRAEINEIERRKPIEKINETKRWLFENINYIDI